MSSQNSNPNQINLWPEGQMPIETPPAEEQWSTHGTDLQLLTGVTVPSITPCLAPDTGKPNPAVLVCPGGAYEFLAWTHEGIEIAQWLNGQGISAFILKYRVPKMRDAALCDAQRAMGLIRQNASQWNIDPGMLGIIGFSAGSHLSVRTSTNFGSRFYAPIDEADTLSSRPDFAMIIYPAYLSTDDFRVMTPGLPVTADTPPTLLIQSEDDVPLIDSSLTYYITLKAAGVPVEMHLYPDGGHGYGLRTQGKSCDVWPSAAEGWLARVTSGRK